MGKNSVNLSQKELEDIEDVWESIKVLSDSLLQEHKWLKSQMGIGSCHRKLSDVNE